MIKSLGVTRGSYLKYEGVFYKSSADNFTPDFYELHSPIGSRTKGYYYGYGIPAYNSSELGEMLPDYVSTTRKNEEGSSWWCEYEVMDGERRGMIYSWGDTEAEARADMLIMLIKWDIIPLIGDI
jgi:hypothetical protein